MTRRTPYPVNQLQPGAPIYWRSLEEREQYAEPSAFDALQKERAAEFTADELAAPSETNGFDRRGFLSIMGASMALAGAAGCRRPVEKIVPYTQMPEQVIPGIPSHYATVINRRGEALGLVVESHEGRPTKIEGNPEHPASRGAADLIAQASILDLYDPDRAKKPSRLSVDSSWTAFATELETELNSFRGEGGARLHILTEPTNSPTVLRLRAAIARSFPNAKFHSYAPVSNSNMREGARLALGQPLQVHVAYDRARVILALDSDFLQTETANVRSTRSFTGGRRLHSPRDTMSRLYVVEPSLTTTGTNADHRLRLPASQVFAYTAALAAYLHDNGTNLGEVGEAVKKLPKPDAVPAEWVSGVAKELMQAHGRSVVVAGSRQPAIVHALASAINQALGSVGVTMAYTTPVDPAEIDVVANIRELAEAIRHSDVGALLILGGNPAYDAPADLGFGALIKKVPFSVHFSSHVTETSKATTWQLPRAHEFEAWGDQRSIEGVYAIQQPLIAPLHDAKSDVELLAMIAATAETNGKELVHATLAETFHNGAMVEADWNRVLRDGVVRSSVYQAMTAVPIKSPEIATAIAAEIAKQPPTAADPLVKGVVEVAFAPDAKMFDGRYANNAWLQELPDPITKISWDNAATLSPKTAAENGVSDGDVIRLRHGGQVATIVAWVVPGQTDGTVGVHLGWGRTVSGRVGTGRGFDVYPLRTTESMSFVTGVRIEHAGERYPVSQTQEHNAMEGRPIAREATLATYKQKPHFAELQAPPPKTLPLWKKVVYAGHKWGMSIDLNACTGCNACVIACQSENNITVVGKEQVAKGREMHWIRIDRYFVGDGDNPAVAYQPLACVQCEEAPCENVCPVNATAHSPEGLNDMAYNRCIGTRYCANNCPYKVRRFNYLDFKGEFWHGSELVEYDKLPKTVKMAQNPNVTVRMRGVMEKCTYCVQRIQRAKIAAKNANRPMRDGEIVPACAQTCPADAISFGDLNNPSSRVARLSELDRKYKLLAEVGTAPRTTYLAKVRNPNSEMKG